MDLKEKFMRAMSFLHESEQPVMSIENLMVLLTVEQAGGITIGDLAKRYKLHTGSVLQQIRPLRTYKVKDTLKGLAYLTVEPGKKMEDRHITVTDEGRAFIQKLIYYVERAPIQ